MANRIDIEPLLLEGLMEIIDPRKESQMRGYIWNRLVPHYTMLVDDVLQETRLAALMNVGAVKNKSRLREWVYVIATRQAAYQVARHKKLYKLPNLNASAIEPIDEKMRTEEITATSDYCNKLLLTLPEEERKILLLADGAGMDANEISRAIGMNPTTVRVKKHRAKMMLGRIAERDSIADYHTPKGNSPLTAQYQTPSSLINK